jgi:uncharacterized protein (TIGR04255 family)
LASREIITAERPPVAEVALAVQFEPNTVRALEAALLWLRLREEFPQYQEQAARPPIEEEFGAPEARPPISFEFMPTPPLPRFWFLSADGSRLVQVQHDLMAANWRRFVGGGDYPRYAALRRLLGDRLRELDEILGEQGEKPVKPNWCEVTYVNHVLPLPGEEDRPEPHRLLRWFAPHAAASLPPLEDVQLNARVVIPDDRSDTPRGRLNASLVSAIRTEDRLPIWVLTLAVRLRSRDETLDGAMAALDEGREWADRAFEQITTEEMHVAWDLRHEASNELIR